MMIDLRNGTQMRKFLAAALIALSLVVPAVHANSAVAKNPYGTTTIDPAGPDEIIFTISKGAKTKSFTAAQLLTLKSSTVSIYEPFVKKRQIFTVIPIESFFNLVGISGSDRVVTMALNDYAYKNSAKSFIAAKTLVAIKRSGTDIAYDEGGPIRLVFADNSRWAKYKDAWNWSLKSISVP